MDFAYLPLVVYREIFTRNFDLKEKLKLRLVCKQWRELIDLFGQESLAIWERPSGVPYQIKWPDTNEPINLNTQLLNIESFKVAEATKDFDRIDISSVFFQNLQRLCLHKILKCHWRRFGSLVNSLNQLPNLSTLYFELVGFGSLTLNLANLNVLCIKGTYFQSLILQTPNLKKFIFFPIDEVLNEKEWDDHKEDSVIEFLYPESLEYVECPVLRLLGDHHFCNLQSLVCQRVVRPFDLKKFAHLKVLSIAPANEERWIVKELKKQRNALGRRDSLFILVYGCEYYESEIPLRMIRCDLLNINMPTRADKYYMDMSYNEDYCYRLENNEMYQVLARTYPRMIGIPMPWHCVIDYPNLVDAFDGRVPANFLDKFTAISVLIATRQVADERKLLDFVRRSAPKRLVLKNIRLHRNFYFELGTVQSIEWLTLGDDLRWTKSGFLSRLANLLGVWVEISQKFPLHFIVQAFKAFSENKRYMWFLGKENFGQFLIHKVPLTLYDRPFILQLKYFHDDDDERSTYSTHHLKSLDELSQIPEVMQHFLE